MATTKNRAARRAAKREEYAQKLQAVPSPAAASQPAAEPVAVPAQAHSTEINFHALPGASSSSDVLRDPRLPTAKTVKVTGFVNAHLNVFLASVGNLSFQDATSALWRAALREEHAAHQQALDTQRRTGQPAQVDHGPIYQALVREVQIMREERLGIRAI